MNLKHTVRQLDLSSRINLNYITNLKITLSKLKPKNFETLDIVLFSQKAPLSVSSPLQRFTIEFEKDQCGSITL